MAALLVYVGSPTATGSPAMAERGFEISRLPGFATVAIAAFVASLPADRHAGRSSPSTPANSVDLGRACRCAGIADAWANDDVKAPRCGR
jgi:hypothetical protein